MIPQKSSSYTSLASAKSALAHSLVEARWGLDIVEIKIIMSVLSKIHKSDVDFKEYVLDAKSLLENIGLGENNKPYLRKILNELMKKLVTIHLDEDKTLVTHWINDAVYDNKNNTIKITLSEQLKPYLINMKNLFTILELQSVVCMKNKYAPQMYAFCNSKLGLKIHKWTFTVLELKTLLGIPEDKYPRWVDLERRVVYPMAEQIRAVSNIHITYEKIGEDIAFHFRYYDQKKLEAYREKTRAERDKEKIDRAERLAMNRKKASFLKLPEEIRNEYLNAAREKMILGKIKFYKTEEEVFDGAVFAYHENKVNRLKSAAAKNV